MLQLRTRIEGAFTGFDDGAVFRLANGQVWQQARYRYRYKYAYCPEVEIRKVGSGFVMDVPCMNDSIQVVPARVVTEDVIVSDFSGFDGETKVEFQNGEIWQQTEYKYEYHYAYRPEAAVIDGINGTVLYVDGMSSPIAVRRLR